MVWQQKHWMTVCLLGLSALAQAKQVSCIGDSITYGAGITDRMTSSYPAQLEPLLRVVDGTWRVTNFGVSATTLLRQGDYPYVTTSAYQNALASEPDIVIIKLGTNDSKTINWIYSEDFVSDYCDLVDSFRALPSCPEVWICKPVPAFELVETINPTVIHDEILPMIEEIAALKGTPVIDLYTALLPYGDLFPDAIHPNAEGAGIMAQTMAPLLLGVNRATDLSGDGVTNLVDWACLAASWHHESESLDLAPVPDGDGWINAWDLYGFSRNWLTFPGIVAYWPLDEETGDTAPDLFGDFNGVLHGEPIWQPQAGVTGGAIQLDGEEDYLYLGQVLNPNDGPLTLIAWIQGGGPNQTILSQGSSSQNSPPLLGTDERGALMTAITDGGRGTEALISDTLITDGQWHEVRLVWDEAYRSLTIDGILVAQDIDSLYSLRSSNTSWLLGARCVQNPNSFWKGLIDEVWIYTSALAQR